MANYAPYENNGGTVAAISGDGFCVIAADTRLSIGFAILSRNCPRGLKLTNQSVIVTSGMNSDQVTLFKVLQARLTDYQQQHHKSMSTTAIAQMLSNTLYSRRFMPYYTFNILGGIDEKGMGGVCHYDAIGNMERSEYGSSGSGTALVQPLLDNQVGRGDKGVSSGRPKDAPPVTKDEAVRILKDAFTSCGERDIYTGDWVDFFVITADGSSDGSGNLTLTISPPIITSGPHQTVNVAPADNAGIVINGTASTGYPQNLMYHKNAMALAVVPMEMPAAAYGGHRESYKGLSVRVIPIYDGTNDISKWRLDLLYGRKVIDPRLGVRVSGS